MPASEMATARAAVLAAGRGAQDSMPTHSSAPADSQPSHATTPTVLPHRPTQGRSASASNSTPAPRSTRVWPADGSRPQTWS
ncbi:hypothetical protein G6F35_018817 [Rhizopus arrhizus]|nr:hypothetical protein G6F35_018817 [Rhizopus arrhizus]